MYTWDTYKFGGNNDGGQTKYNFTDNLMVLEHEDDICTITYGKNYNTPNIDNIQELIDETDYEWVTNFNDIPDLNGYKLMKKNDHSVFVFFPAAGSLGATRDFKTTNGMYVSSTRSPYYENRFLHLKFFKDNYIQCDRSMRRFGFTVRPVTTLPKS